PIGSPHPGQLPDLLDAAVHPDGNADAGAGRAVDQHPRRGEQHGALSWAGDLAGAMWEFAPRPMSRFALRRPTSAGTARGRLAVGEDEDALLDALLRARAL